LHFSPIISLLFVYLSDVISYIYFVKYQEGKILYKVKVLFTYGLFISNLKEDKDIQVLYEWIQDFEIRAERAFLSGSCSVTGIIMADFFS
jgi:hypothetical protein